MLSSLGFMSNDNLEVGFNPPEEEEKADDTTDLILDTIKELGCSYPSEICGVLDISKDTVYRKVRFLEHTGKIKRMSLGDTRIVPEWLQPRIKDLWAHGLKGKTIRRMTWYTVVEGEVDEQPASS